MYAVIIYPVVNTTQILSLDLEKNFHYPSKSDLELTCASGVIENLNGKQNISMMVDRRFNVHDQLK